MGLRRRTRLPRAALALACALLASCASRIYTSQHTHPNDGHCIAGLGYNTSGVQVDSWGLIGTITWDAIAQYCSDAAGGNLFAVLTRDILAGARAATPDALDWDALVADMTAMGGDVAGSL